MPWASCIAPALRSLQQRPAKPISRISEERDAQFHARLHQTKQNVASAAAVFTHRAAGDLAGRISSTFMSPNDVPHGGYSVKSIFRISPRCEIE
jgi:hypothetical protein